jgi:hypothetical protein
MPTYYISQTGTATKAEAVNPATPMSVATHNASTFVAGDRIRASSQGGDIATGLVIPSAGASGNPIVYEAVSGESPRIVVATGTALTVAAGKHYVTVDGLYLETQQSGSNFAAWVSGAATSTTFTNCTFKGVSFGLGASGATTNLTTSGCLITGANASGGIYLYNAAHTNINISATHNSGYGLRLSGAGGAITGRVAITTTATVASACHTITSVNCASIGDLELTFNISGTTNYPCDIVGCNNLLISGGTWVGANQFRLVTTLSTNIVVYGVTFQQSMSTPFYTTVTGCSGISVIGCTFDRCTSGGPGFNAVAGVQVRGNLIMGCTGDGIITLGGTTNALIEGNRVFGNGNKASTSDGDGITCHDTDNGIVVRNNLIVGNTASGVAMVGTSSGDIYNNVIVGNAGNWLAAGTGVNQVRGGVYISTSGVNATSGRGWRVRNNIIANNYPVEIHCTALSAPTVDSDYNCIWATDPAKVASITGLSTFLDWTAYSVREPHSINAAPLFVDTANSDYRLQPASPFVTQLRVTGADRYLASAVDASRLATDKATVAAELLAQAGQIVSVTVLEQVQAGAAVTEATAQTREAEAEAEGEANQLATDQAIVAANIPSISRGATFLGSTGTAVLTAGDVQAALTAQGLTGAKLDAIQERTDNLPDSPAAVADVDKNISVTSTGNITIE